MSIQYYFVMKLPYFKVKMFSEIPSPSILSFQGRFVGTSFDSQLMWGSARDQGRESANTNPWQVDTTPAS